MLRLKNERGFTLTELVISLAVIGVMVGAFTITRLAIESARLGRAINEMEIIATGAGQYAAQNGGSFAGLYWDTITNLGLVPASMMYPNHSTPWGRYYHVWADCNNNCFGLGSFYYVPGSSANQLSNALLRKGTTSVSADGNGYCHFQIRYDK